MPARPVVRALCLGALGAAVFWGCTLDWTVRGDVVPGSSSGSPEASSEAARPLGDASDTEAETPDAEAGACTTLTTTLVDARKRARECTTVGPLTECQVTVKDECDCDVVVRLLGVPRTTELQNAVKAFVDAGCSKACPLCKPTTGKSCLANGGPLECYP